MPRESLAFTLRGSGSTTVAISERSITEWPRIPARLEGSLRLSHCSSIMGPLIVTQVSVVLSGLRAIVTFCNGPDRNDVPRNEVAFPLAMIGSGERIPVRPGSTLRGIPGRASLSIRLQHDDGHWLTEERELGECADGAMDLGIPFMLGARVQVWANARELTERGPALGLSGHVVLARGMAARLRFHPSGSPADRSGEDTRIVPLVSPGTAWFTPEIVLESGSPDRAWAFVRLELDDHARASGEHVLGRCVRADPGRHS